MQMEQNETDKLEDLKEEMEGLKNVWTELDKVWNMVVGKSETLLAYANPTKMKKSVSDALEQLNSFSRRLRQYEAFEVMQSKIKKHKRLNFIIIELKSEAIKERHWQKLLKLFGV